MSDTAVRRLADALHDDGNADGDRDTVSHTADAHWPKAAAILAADPGLSEAIELGLAWAAAEAVVGRHEDGPADLGVVPRLGGYGAYTIRDGDAIEEFGSTPTLALLALKDKIGGKAE